MAASFGKSRIFQVLWFSVEAGPPYSGENPKKTKRPGGQDQPGPEFPNSGK
jgi:hypothetical protein